MIGTFLSCCLYGAYAFLGYIVNLEILQGIYCGSYGFEPSISHFSGFTSAYNTIDNFNITSEPGRITFICNPALSPPTVLLQLYIKCHTASLRLSTLWSSVGKARLLWLMYYTHNLKINQQPVNAVSYCPGICTLFPDIT